MNDIFEEQNDILRAIQHEIKLLNQQVDFLIRNGKPLGLLDLDVMMNRTHTIYDMLCGQLGADNEETTDEEKELEIDPDELAHAIMGAVEPVAEVEKIEEIVEEEPVKEEIPEEPVETAVEEKKIEEVVEEELVEEELVEEEPVEEEPVEETPVEEETDFEENEDAYFEEEANDDEQPQTAKQDDFGFILNFEPVEEVFTPGDEVEMSVPQMEIQEEEEEDGNFEIETPGTLGEKLQQEQDPTLADKLQHGSVTNLQAAIGINDKFLFVNELFGGSMEKYNRSIENLDDLKTLNGALIYLNELRIELQWNSSNEAYKKLLELVHRKFEA